MSAPGDGRSGLAPELIAAYRAARYRVTGVAPAFELTIDEHSAALAACHRTYGVRCSAFLTAWNPGSRPRAAAANAAAAAALAGRLRATGYTLVAARGIDPSGAWPAEESVLVPGLGRPEAEAIGREFGQAALVHAGADAVPRLVLLE